MKKCLDGGAMKDTVKDREGVVLWKASNVMYWVQWSPNFQRHTGDAKDGRIHNKEH